MGAEYVILSAFASLLLITSHVSGLKCFSCGGDGDADPGDPCTDESECGKELTVCVYSMVPKFALTGPGGAAELKRQCANGDTHNAFVDQRMNKCATPEELNGTDVRLPYDSVKNATAASGNPDLRFAEYCICDKDLCNFSKDTASGAAVPPPTSATTTTIFPEDGLDPVTSGAGTGAECLVKSKSPSPAATLIFFLWTSFNIFHN